MRIMTAEQASEFLRGLGLDVTTAWVEKMAEPDAAGKRGLPFFKLTGGKTARLYTTDEALETYFRQHAGKALQGVFGEPVLTDFLQAADRQISAGDGKQGVRRGPLASRRG